MDMDMDMDTDMDTDTDMAKRFSDFKTLTSPDFQDNCSGIRHPSKILAAERHLVYKVRAENRKYWSGCLNCLAHQYRCWGGGNSRL